MKTIITIFSIILIFLSIYFLQVNFFSWFNIAGVMPNLFIIFIMIIGLFLKKEAGFIFGIVFGLLLDFFIGERIGINAIALSSVGFVAGIIEKNFSKDNRITVMIITAILTLCFEVIIYILNIVFLGNTNIEIMRFIKVVAIEILYNVILIIILYPLFSKVKNKLEQDLIENKSFLS